jgi:4-alpha-glucanotransferase
MNAQLHQLAGLYGLKTSYQDMQGRTQSASVEALMAVLKSLGAPVTKLEDVAVAIRQHREEYWKRTIEPVIVCWENERLSVILRLHAKSIGLLAAFTMVLESGAKSTRSLNTDQITVTETAEVEGVSYVSLRLDWPEALPSGYHRLFVDLGGDTSETLIISAPARAYIPLAREKIWGPFIPLYALHSSSSWGAGNFSDLSRLMSWTSTLGGGMVSTLPLLSSFFDDVHGPGPYMPASRLFWNEFYLDIEAVPELQSCPAAQAIMASDSFKRDIAALRSSRWVDYNQQLSLKRSVLEEMAAGVFAGQSPRLAELQSYVKSNPRLEDYARFRAAGEQLGIHWDQWPEAARKGRLEPDHYSEKNYRYHLYVQWLAQQQIANLSQKGLDSKVKLYLDVPVGVHPYSYDVWREYEAFAQGIKVGAPPDPVFTNGQDWSFPPLHPEKIRLQGYHYVIDSLRHQLKSANMLRIDHMMGLHRLFCIPQGMPNREGLYIGYHAEELYAILTLESVRHQAIIVGEDLGMVPPEVRPMMEKHGIFRMYVGQYELIVENQINNIPAQSVGCLNTHDMFPFASFWEEKDIDERQKIKLIDAAAAQKELEERRNVKRSLISLLQYRGLDNAISQSTAATLLTILKLLAASPAYGISVNLEDLWLESHPQNIPGTRRSQNWTHKTHCTFEEFSQSPQVLEILRQINSARKSKDSPQ